MPPLDNSEEKEVFIARSGHHYRISFPLRWFSSHSLPPLPKTEALFDAARDCRRVHTGSEVNCGAPWAAPCFDRRRCQRIGGGSAPLLSIYVHDGTCSMRASSEIIAGYRGIATPDLWEEAAKTMRYIAAQRCVSGRDRAANDRRQCFLKTAFYRGVVRELFVG